jgi:hypothetical protein
MRDLLGFPYFPICHTFVYMCNLVWGDKIHFTLCPQTKMHIQKCYTCRDIEAKSRNLLSHSGTVPTWLRSIARATGYFYYRVLS